MKKQIKNVDWMGNAKSIGGGMAGEIVMNLLDTNIPQFSSNKNLSPIAVAAAGVLGQMFMPKEYHDLFKGMVTTSGVEIARAQGVIKGINDTLGDIVPSIFNHSNQRIEPQVLIR
jgi:hypothetical protein